MTNKGFDFELWQIRLTATFVAAGISLILIFWRVLPPQIPLFYSQTWGVDQLAHPGFLWLIPGWSLILGGVTYTLTQRIINDPVLKATAILSTLAIQSILTLALIRIIVLMV